MKSQQGHTLIELMIAMTLGLMLVSSLLVVYANASSSSKSNERMAEVQANGRFAISTLKADLRAAGFKGLAWAPPNTPSTPRAPIGNECLEAGAAAGSFASNIGQGIWGSQDSNPFSANCIPRSHYARGDVLVIRKVSPAPTTGLVPGQLYLRSSYAASEIFQGVPTVTCPAPMSGYAAPFNMAPCLIGKPGVDLLDFQMEIHVYFIRNYTVSATESPLTPALCRLTLRSDGVMVEEMMASGIEDMRIQYARTLTDGSPQYFEAGSIQGTSSSSTHTDWDDVTAVRLWLLARSSSAEPGYTNKTVYSLASSTLPRNPASAGNGDGYRRQLFSTVVHLRNSAPHN